MNFTVNTHRLLALYHSASPAERHEGTHWYDSARQFALDTAEKFNYTLEEIAGVIAVTSPRQGWGANKDTAYTLAEYAYRKGSYEDAIADPLVRGFNTNTLKAWRILHGEDAYTVVKGPKVMAFYLNILGHSNHITLDSHAMNAWAGECRPEWPKKLHPTMRDDYKLCAQYVGVSPSEFQAVVWVVHRRRVNVSAHHDMSILDIPTTPW